MQRLGVGPRNDFSHPLDVASGSLQQSAQVVPGLMGHVASPQAKEKREFLVEFQESRCQLLQGSWSMSFLLPLTVLLGEEAAFSASVDQPCHCLEV